MNQKTNNSLFQVNLSGVLKVLSDSLYSKKEVFIRELLQNAIDAIKAKQKIIDFKPQISVEFFSKQTEKGLIFSDNGIGLNETEVEEFLSKIGSSSKSTNNLMDQRNDFIGQFGIGLLSCFMVSNEIIVHTKSAKENNSAVKWTGNIDGTYKTELVNLTENSGTKVILKFRPYIEFTNDTLIQLLQDYGQFIDFPIELEIDSIATKLNQTRFPWEVNNNEYILQQGFHFFKQHFQHYIPIETLDKKTKGIAYILPRSTHHGAGQANRVYIKNMFITDKAIDLVPDWAFFVKVVINSETLAPTASREEIYKDKNFENTKDEIGDIIKSYLKKLDDQAPIILEKILSIHGTALKSLALTDESFLKFIYKWFNFQTNKGNLTLAQIKDLNEPILYLSNIDEYKQIVPIATANNTLIVNAGYIYEAELLDLISDFDKNAIYQRINSEYYGNILNDLDINDYNLFEHKLEILQTYLVRFKCMLNIKKFNPNHVAALFYMSEKALINRDMTSIKEESDELWSFVSDNVFASQENNFISTLFLNYNNSVVLKLLNNKNAELDELFIETLYINAMMSSQYPLGTIELEAMNKNMITLIDKLQ